MLKPYPDSKRFSVVCTIYPCLRPDRMQTWNDGAGELMMMIVGRQRMIVINNPTAVLSCSLTVQQWCPAIPEIPASIVSRSRLSSGVGHPFKAGKTDVESYNLDGMSVWILDNTFTILSKILLVYFEYLGSAIPHNLSDYMISWPNIPSCDRIIINTISSIRFVWFSCDTLVRIRHSISAYRSWARSIIHKPSPRTAV